MKKVLVILGSVLAIAIAAMPIAALGARSDRPSGMDKSYLMTSMKGDLFEIQGGRLALRKSHNKAVLRLARTLISDHSMSYAESADLAKRLGIGVPTAPTESMRWELKIVSALRGHAFNYWYSSLEVYDHEQDLSETSDEIDMGHNAEVRRDARKSVPMLQKHLRLAREAFRASK